MKEGRDLVNEAVNDAKALKEAALTAAKNELLDSMAPAIKELLEKSIGNVLGEKRGLTGRIGQSQRGDHFSPQAQKWEEDADKGEAQMDKEAPKKDDQELDLESLASFFPAMSEEPEAVPGEEVKVEDPGAMMSGIPTLGEAEEEEGEEVKEGKKKKEGEEEEEEEEKMEETIEISESELKKVYEAALATEASVKKGFGDMTKAGELDQVVKDTGKGLNPEKKGEKMWGEKPDSELEAQQDFTVKEMIQKGMAENKSLRENLKKAVDIIRTLGARLHEVNLFNAKVLHVNSVLNKHNRLTAEQKQVVLESIDKAKTIDEVKMVYEAITNSFAAGKLTESKTNKPTANAQRARSSGAANQKVLSESVDRNQNEGFSRLQQLAGLVSK